MDFFKNLTNISQPPDLTILILTAWTLLAKGFALWHASKNDQRYWFIAILIINTLGVLEIIYLLRFAKKKLDWQYFKSLLQK